MLQLHFQSVYFLRGRRRGQTRRRRDNRITPELEFGWRSLSFLPHQERSQTRLGAMRIALLRFPYCGRHIAHSPLPMCTYNKGERKGESKTFSPPCALASLALTMEHSVPNYGLNSKQSASRILLTLEPLT